MTSLFRNEFVEILLDQANGIIEMAWTALAAQMTEDDFKHIFETYAALVEEHHPYSLLAHSQNPSYVVTPAMQRWIDENIIPRAYWAGVKNAAMVMHQNILVQISVEQIMEEPHAQWINWGFFPSVKAAREWLLKQQNNDASEGS